MNKIKYNLDEMKFMSIFESLTNAQLKDCINKDTLIFIVKEGEIAKAIGKKGINAKKVEKILKKRIKIVEFSNDVLKFVENFIIPLKAKNIKQENKKIIIESQDLKTRGYLIGKNASNLRNMEDIVKRYFDIDEIKIV